METPLNVNECDAPVKLLHGRENPKLTVGEACDLRIERARKRVLELCTHKAKLEALNMLNMPFREIQVMIDGH